MHIVELQYGDDATAKVVATMRKWLDSGKAQPTIRYSLLGQATVLRVDFELEKEAHAFAQAFGGTVLRNDIVAAEAPADPVGAPMPPDRA